MSDSHSPVRQTSRLAYHTLVTQGLLPKRRREVYAALFAAGPCTGSELWRFMEREGTGIRGNVRARLTELRDAGLAREVEQRPCRVTGQVALVWDVTDAAVPAPIPRNISVRRQALDLLDEIKKWADQVGLNNLARYIQKRVALMTEREGK